MMERDTEGERGWGTCVCDRLDVEKNGEKVTDENDMDGSKWNVKLRKSYHCAVRAFILTCQF